MQFKVPQDVLRADKIVAFLTLRQLLICTTGGAITYSVYIILNKQYILEIWLPPVLFCGLFTAAFAFVKFHDIVFEKVVLYAVEYFFKPRARWWQKMNGDVLISVLSPISSEEKNTHLEQTPLTEEERRKKMKEMTLLVDSRGLKNTKKASNKDL